MLVVSWKLECYLDARGNNPVGEFIEHSPSVTCFIKGADRILGGDGNRVRAPLSPGLKQ